MILTEIQNSARDIQYQTHSFQATSLVDTGRFRSTLENFNSLTLEEIGGASLLDRQETKYIFHQSQILNFLPKLVEDYQILEIQGSRISNYRTIYFDTAERFGTPGNYVNGANIGGFLKVADVMLDQGVV